MEKTCSNCIHRDGGVCNECPDENGEVGTTTECSPKGNCVNWESE